MTYTRQPRSMRATESPFAENYLDENVPTPVKETRTAAIKALGDANFYDQLTNRTNPVRAMLLSLAEFQRDLKIAAGPERTGE